MHKLAVSTSVATFFLLVIGGLVHGTDSGLACPDWVFVPLCYGQLFPKMAGGVLFEHGHRLFATGVGIMTVVLAILMIHNRKRDTGLLWLGAAAVLLVCLQGVLGGLTVLYKLPVAVSSAHLATSMLFFCLVIYIAHRTRQRHAPTTLSLGTRRLLGAALGLTYLQIVMGAVVRHLNAGLACFDWPLCAAGFWPAVGLQQVHTLHRLLAVVVAAFVIAAAVQVGRATSGAKRWLCVAACFLICAQIALGVLSVMSFLALVPITAHLAFGGLLLATLWILWLGTKAHLTHGHLVESVATS